MCSFLGIGGCNDVHSSVAPAAPSPALQPTGLQPIVTAVTPNLGSTAGGAWGIITGSQFQSGLTVRLGKSAQQAFFQSDRTIIFWTTAHLAGTTDVVVTNPGGLSGGLPGGFTFAPPESFDFTGDWIAHAGPDYETDMRFAIRNNLLVSLGCGPSESVAVSPPPPVYDGAFSFVGAEGITVSGHVVSPINAVGTINVPGCTATRWWADKRDAIQTAPAR